MSRMKEFEVINLDKPTDVRSFERGRFDLIQIAGTTVGRATYEPGWRWSEHVGTGPDDRCQVAHLGVVLSGRAAVHMDDGTELTLSPGDVFAIPPGHDSWVVGDEPYVSLHLAGADEYAQ
jgi:quercetin dioxygenase-like cupin family protein